ncbi:MAG: hypothetical protein ACKVU4_03970 [Phycisphaerales bacterium]
MTEWWSFQDSVLVGSIGGGGFGTLVGLLGAAAGVLAPRGMAKRLVLGAFIGALAVGIAGLSAGVFAVIIGQPYHVWYGLVLIGGITTVVMGSLLPVVVVRYRQAEARKLEAEELRRT